jgi:two-component system sensor histidine kinase HydH
MSTGMSTREGLEVTPSAARAHAIKNCLSAITTICTVIERREAAPSPRLRKSLRSASLRLQELLAEHLATEVGSSVTTSTPGRDWCSVEGVTATATERLWARAEGAGVSLSISCGGGELRCNGDSLIEALVDLTANAIEATPPGGRVTVQTRETPDGDQVWVVKDSGCGFLVAPGVAPEFRPPSTKAGGWGLGFSLARIAVARHGGVMSITSAPGEGTTIAIWLPRQSAGIEQGEPEAGSIPCSR